ncbi:hypothetical protein NCS57_00702400 [Fusarium keratoplasticum]|uniref:Uncharacterized protein n=1 Tax=Fusarium keratoplasticum TaxID=1328300 RepID=A0ACC0QZ07_9HYPO|nr:hypothetical protein NCS57_00702400 [Fusarium keratoplasticum]KAI8668892.1 hypothetical protein NCS57_00702400 [Fusarium keratoplasticum]
MRGNVLCLAFAASLAFEAVAQTTITVGVDDEDDSFSSVTTSATKSEDPRTCGYVDGDPDLPVTCSSSCAILSVSGRDSIHLGCCDDDQCDIRTTCIESGTPSGRATLVCTEESSSRCGTLTWPDLSGERYSCANIPVTLTVATKTTTETLTSSTRDIVDATTAAPDPDGGPGMGWEHDLSSRQRVGAGIGSGVIGGLLLIFFGIFGCWRGPEHPRTQRQDTEQSDVHLPGEKAATKRRVTNRVKMEETQPSASWTPSPVNIQSPQPLRPQPPYYSTSDIPGSSMGYRNPQY